MTRVTLDLTKLVADGALSAAEAERLRGLGEVAGRSRIIVNVLLIFGALAVTAGVLAFQPPLDVGLGLAIGAVSLGGVLIYRAKDEWGLLGQALVLMGVLGVCAWIGMRFNEFEAPWPSAIWPLVTLLTLAGAVCFRNAVLAALVPIALGHWVGSGTGYWHASYFLFVREATISIGVFTLLGVALFWGRARLPEAYNLVTTVMARVSFFLANFGFWIGSLWGDHPGELWATASMEHAERSAWREQAFYIPELAFSVGWAAFLIAAIVVGVRTQRRFISNTAIVFLAIHLYTQLFEVLGAQPLILVAGGISLIAFGVGLARFDRWQRERRTAV